MPIRDFTGNNWEEMARRPKPTNERLRNLFAGIDLISIKPGGSSELRTQPNKVLFEIAQPDAIKQFAALIEINEVAIGFHCMCLGTYDVELYTNNQLQATISYHHEYSIRCDLWSTDAALANPEGLVTFLAEQGFKKPLEDLNETKRQKEASYLADQEWLAISPKCFRTFWEKFGSYGDFPEELIDALNNEIPDKAARIIALLQTFGKTKNFWSGYPSYENVPADILNTYHPMVILKAYTDSDRNYKTRRGLGRYLCSFDFRKIRKKYLNYISEEVIDDLEKCFTSIGEEKGIYEINRLRNEKNKKNGKQG
jgi:hypothetical protein